MQRRLLFPMLAALTVSVLVQASLPRDGVAYPRYRLSGGLASCSDCHPGFLSRGPLHDMHVGNNQMTGTCLLCHDAGPGDIPFTYQSGATGGQGCRGCHGRDNNTDFNWGAGLRAHHANAGAPPDINGQVCSDCHNDPPASPENHVPVYYTRGDVNLLDPCLTDPAAGGEDYDDDGQGLDNDGDLAYDATDTDCSNPTDTDDLSHGANTFALHKITPNPSVLGETRLVFSTPRNGTTVTFDLFDVRGRHVLTRRYNNLEGGRNTIRFDGRDANGTQLQSGVYLIRLRAGTQTVTGRFALIQ